MFHKNEMSPIIKTSGTNFYSLLYVKSGLGLIRPNFAKETCHFKGAYSFSRDESEKILMPLKNGLIALWPNTRAVKCKYCVSQKQNGFDNKGHW